MVLQKMLAPCGAFAAGAVCGGTVLLAVLTTLVAEPWASRHEQRCSASDQHVPSGARQPSPEAWTDRHAPGYRSALSKLSGAEVEMLRGDALSDAAYLKVLRRWCPRCSRSPWLDWGHNRTDPWSLHERNFRHTPGVPVCSTPDQLAAALKLGRRRWDAAVLRHVSALNETERDVALERRRSWFEPFGCRIPFYSSAQACAVLSRFAAMFIVGDSLGRHMTGGLFMALTDDYKSGGYPRFGGQIAPELLDQCVCDGQFSEEIHCRSFDTNFYTAADVRSYGVCPGVRVGGFGFQFLGTWGLKPYGQIANVPFNPEYRERIIQDGRPVLTVIQAGIHQRHNLTRALEETFAPATAAIKNFSRLSRGKVFTLFMGSHAESRRVDPSFPDQTREYVAKYHAGLEKEAARVGAFYFDFWNLTANAATQDGVHMLSDTQVIKAMSMLHLAHLLSHEQQ
jgi:hypothetical protein